MRRLLVPLGVFFFWFATLMHHREDIDAGIASADPTCVAPISVTMRTPVRGKRCDTEAARIERAYVEDHGRHNAAYHIVVSTEGGTFDVGPGDFDDEAYYDYAAAHIGTPAVLRLRNGKPILLATARGWTGVDAYLVPGQGPINETSAIGIGVVLVVAGLWPRRRRTREPRVVVRA